MFFPQFLRYRSACFADPSPPCFPSTLSSNQRPLPCESSVHGKLCRCQPRARTTRPPVRGVGHLAFLAVAGLDRGTRLAEPSPLTATAPVTEKASTLDSLSPAHTPRRFHRFCRR